MLFSPLLNQIECIQHGFGTKKDVFDAGSKPWLAKQIHSDHIIELSEEGNVPLSEWVEADAIISARRGQPIGVQTADCLPMLVIAPDISHVAVIHAGWKGSAARITGKVIQRLIHKNAKPNKIKISMGPCIQAKSYEVDDKVFREIDKTFEMTSDIVQPKGEGKYWLDLVAINRWCLLTAGVLPEHIDAIDLCTYVREDLFYSYRRDGEGTGRQVSWIELI